MLTACQTELFTFLEESEANEMMAILLENGIDANKVTGKKSLATITVEKSDMSFAIQLLKDHGFPRVQYDSLGTIFEKDGLISSPIEERARYVFAVSQELSETLSLLDGVISSRVHIVLPELDNTGDITSPSSASVFIKYQEGLNMDGIVPQIKLLVNNSIEGLDYGKISVVLFPSRTIKSADNPRMVKVLFFEMSAESAQTFYVFLSIIILLLLVSAAGVIMMRKFKK